MIRLGYFAAVDELERPHGKHSQRPREQDMDGHASYTGTWHLAHCFDYLRQAILCAGDTTIEWAREAEEGANPSQVDGWGIEHQCRSSKAIFDFTATNRAINDADGIVNAGVR